MLEIANYIYAQIDGWFTRDHKQQLLENATRNDAYRMTRKPPYFLSLHHNTKLVDQTRIKNHRLEREPNE